MPTATPFSFASATVLRMTCGSPAWKPPATLAEEMYCIISSSKPIFQGPKLSPMSQLRSTRILLTCLSMSGLPQGLPDFLHVPPPIIACPKRLFEIRGPEAGLVVGLGLGQFVAIRAYDGSDGCVAAAGHGVVHQHDGLDSARHLDGAYRVAEVHHVRRVTPGASGLLPLDELELAAPVAVADAVSVRGDGPCGVQELLHTLLGQAVAGKTDESSQLRRSGVGGDVIVINALADLLAAARRLDDLQLVALLQGAS